MKEWMAVRRGRTVAQVLVSLSLTFAFAAPLVILLVGLQNPDTLPTWLSDLLGSRDGVIPYSSLSFLVLALVGLWIATAGLTGIFRATILAKEITALATRVAKEIGASPAGDVVRRSKQRLNIERQLIDAHYSLAVTGARAAVFVVVALLVSPAPLILGVVAAQVYLLRSGLSRFRDGRELYERFESIHARSGGKVGDTMIVTEFGEWLGESERKFNALPVRDYAVTAAIVTAAVAWQLAFGGDVSAWSGGIPIVGVWAFMALDASRALAHYGFSLARWSAATTGDFF